MIVVCVSVVVYMKLCSTSDWTMQLLRILFSSALVCCVYNDCCIAFIIVACMGGHNNVVSHLLEHGEQLHIFVGMLC